MSYLEKLQRKLKTLYHGISLGSLINLVTVLTVYCSSKKELDSLIQNKFKGLYCLGVLETILALLTTDQLVEIFFQFKKDKNELKCLLKRARDSEDVLDEESQRRLIELTQKTEKIQLVQNLIRAALALTKSGSMSAAVWFTIFEKFPSFAPYLFVTSGLVATTDEIMSTVNGFKRWKSDACDFMDGPGRAAIHAGLIGTGTLFIIQGFLRLADESSDPYSKFNYAILAFSSLALYKLSPEIETIFSSCWKNVSTFFRYCSRRFSPQSRETTPLLSTGGLPSLPH